MKKLILLSSAFMFVALTSIAGGEHCSSKEKKSCESKKECTAEQKTACATGADKKCSTKDAKCSKEKVSTQPKAN